MEVGESDESGESFFWPPSWWKSRSFETIRDAHKNKNKASAMRVIPFGLPDVDSMLGGGVNRGLITEIVGEASAGKTQTAMHLIVQTMILQAKDEDYLGGWGVYWIYTEGPPPITRLFQMMQGAVREILGGAQGGEGTPSVVEEDTGRGIQREEGGDGEREKEFETRVDELTERLMNSVFIEQVNSDEDLWVILGDKVDRLVSLVKIRLVVLDSVAALFRVLPPSSEVPAASWERGGLSQSAVSRRALKLTRISAVLRRLADERELAVVVTNHVTGRPTERSERERQGNGELSLNAGSETAPALGLAWSNCVNCRLSLARVKRKGGGGDVEMRQKRKAEGEGEGDAGGRNEPHCSRGKLRRLDVVFSPRSAASSVSSRLPGSVGQGDRCWQSNHGGPKKGGFFTIDPSGLIPVRSG
uniref:RecA family profile 1 domain-containing protein n=1 Tax=Chromera velia CCMP2878 TaxID=1169474 RepID=A0A0G4HPR2_9ALVE|eukprot:Cvel_7868.t1-p1 / transcript=Cvel_7868.t1 / gene=Cvel_7868 / organism=Chromera_velia_CCMP2878 / gene_product=DNA repair protein XRCC3 homolog, putative / transcript_product=DNA repair protein XRCC3 homolog, putative / location=Cvel_scaffold421:64421-68437(-) / protein_length=415 / sequence_SO=supercontig / SO=protein_coding / is_pseudo=false